jgi:hypothetical protein
MREIDVTTQRSVRDVWAFIGDFKNLPVWDRCVREAELAPDGYWRVKTAGGETIYGQPCYSEGAGYCSVNTVWEYDNGSLAMRDSWHVHDRGTTRNVNCVIETFRLKGICCLPRLTTADPAVWGVSDKNELLLASHPLET